MEPIGITSNADAQYTRGDDVVVRLAGLQAFRLDSGRPACCLPEWTIAAVLGAVDDGYALRFEYEGRRLICVAPASSIEGVA